MFSFSIILQQGGHKAKTPAEALRPKLEVHYLITLRNTFPISIVACNGLLFFSTICFGEVVSSFYLFKLNPEAYIHKEVKYEVATCSMFIRLSQEECIAYVFFDNSRHHISNFVLVSQLLN